MRETSGRSLAIEVDCGHPVGRLRNHFDIGLIAENLRYATPDDRVIVGEQDANRQAWICLLGPVRCSRERAGRRRHVSASEPQ